MTHDTHFTKEQVKTNWPPASGVAYEESLEGTKDGHGIPVHCIKLSEGYQIQKDILAACQSLNEEGKPARFFAIDKYTFGWDGWKDYLKFFKFKKIVSVTSYLPKTGFFKFKKIVIFGFVAGICVDSQATIFRALYPNIPIEVDAACTAGFTEEDEKAAYLVMRMKQIDVVNE